MVASMHWIATKDGIGVFGRLVLKNRVVSCNERGNIQ